MTTDNLLVCLRYPEPGKVKTRLAATIGFDRAAALYRDWIGLVLHAMQPLRPRVRVVGFHEGAAVEAFAQWHGLADVWWPQPPGDLGERLEEGFRRAHALGGRVLAIGTDCLDLDAELVRAALDWLEQNDAVFGPAEDGGYYLVGTRTFRPGFFEAVRWSSPHTLADHLTRCRELGLSASLLPTKRDIDTWDDWADYCRRHGRTP